MAINQFSEFQIVPPKAFIANPAIIQGMNYQQMVVQLWGKKWSL
jgi:hypothetical protein